MPIQSLEQRKRQKTLLIVMLAIVLITVIVLYFGFWSKTPVPSGQFGPGEAGTVVPGISIATEEKLKKINLDFDFLNEEIIPFLKIHGEIPVSIQEDEIGRTNPFIPY